MINNQWVTGEEAGKECKLNDFELIDYCGKEVTPHLKTSKRPYRICSGAPGIRRLADGRLTLVTSRKLEKEKRTLNYPSMKDFYYLNGVEPPKTFDFNPDQHECIPDWGILLPHLEHCLFKREEVEKLKKKLSPWNRQKEKKKEYLRDTKLIELFKKIKLDLEYLYNNLEETPGFSYERQPKERLLKLKEETIKILKQIDQPYLKLKYADDSQIYETQDRNTPRDFIGRLLQKVVKDQLNKKTDYQVLYEAFREI